jgi:IS30 family transposase
MPKTYTRLTEEERYQMYERVTERWALKLLEPEKEHLHTITFDNGKEFAYHAQIKKALGADS